MAKKSNSRKPNDRKGRSRSIDKDSNGGIGIFPSGRLRGAHVIAALGNELRYSRPHLMKVMKENARRLGIKREGKARWLWSIPSASVPILRRLVASESGPRFKLGERRRGS